MPIRLYDYDPQWPQRYQQLATAIGGALGAAAIRVDHIGSTSVAGMPAKDVIDIQVAVASLEPERPYREPLERLGFSYLPDRDLGHRFFKLDGPSRRRVANVHVCLAGGEWELDHLCFRDALRQDRQLVSSYAQFKQVISQQFDDAVDFAEAKDLFIRNALAQRIPGRAGRLPPPDTDRLHFREYSLGDLDLTAKLLGDPSVMRYYPSPKTRPESLAWIQWNLASYRQFGFGLWVIEMRATGEFVGDCGLTVQEVEGRKDVELGYHLRPQLWGRGLATEAAAGCRDFARDRVRLRRLIAIIHPDNLGSLAVASKIGMALQGEHRRQQRARAVYAMALLPGGGGGPQAGATA